MPTPSGGFRPDIQGMRALAVLLVIVAHAGFRTASGGYIGVDVFFVISGFLITSLLLREVSGTGRVSLLDFYARRARRILPASAVVIVGTVLAAAVALPAVRVLEIFKDGVWSAFFAANVRFAVVGTDYFARGEPTSPLQHFWSLAVEEQFYLVWPLLLGIWVLLRARTRLRPAWGMLAAAALIGASLGWSVLASGDSPVTAYFSTFTRAWELGAGAMLAWWLQTPRQVPRAVRSAFGFLGLAAILAATVAFDASTVFPGYLAAVPVLGTVLLILAGSSAAGPDTVVSRLLSVRPARLIGDWSFSLYLWHWPVLRILEDRLGVARLPHLTLLLALALVFGLSALTYYWVEEPFRRGRLWRPRLRGLALYPASVAMVVAVAAVGHAVVAASISGGDAPAIETTDYAAEELSADPQVALVQASVLAAREGHAVPGDLTPPLAGLRKQTAPLGECDYRTGTTRLCPTGAPSAERSVVLIGDSHARAWSPALEEIGRQREYAVYNLVYSGCSATLAVQATWDSERAWPECEAFKQWALEVIDQLRPELVVVATSANSPVLSADGSRPVGVTDDTPEFLDLVTAGMAEMLARLRPLSGEVAVLGNTPRLGKEPGVCLTSGEVDLGDCLFEPGRQLRRIQARYRRAAEQQGVRFVDAARWFCHQGLCASVVGRTVTMRDREHITPDYARQLAGPLADALGLSADGVEEAGGPPRTVADSDR